MNEREYVLTLACPDSRGIVAGVANLLADHGCNITESQQYGDNFTGRFFLRMQFVTEAGVSGPVSEDELRGAFAALASDFGRGPGDSFVEWALQARDVRPRMIVMVSKFGHCLNDLLYRQRSGLLDIDIAAVVSNHPDLEFLANSYGVDFHHLPVTPETKREQEGRILELVDSYDVDLVVLARYMQVLSEQLCTKMSGRIINIHHSFLPSFKGARPYHQAHSRGVKLIGATAHYVTADLDEGPIIEQEVSRVGHTQSPEQLTAIGRDLESVSLARAVNWHAQRRVLLNGEKTVIFD
ncbi:formyltetrahydrofolate deformylase [Nocardiopsis nanhaiensis]